MIRPLGFAITRILTLAALFPLLGLAAEPFVKAPRTTRAPFAIATFHCLGLYWSPADGAIDKPVLVRFRPQGAPESAWRGGYPLRFHPIPGTDEDLADYRGSLVHLTPGTTYEIELKLVGTETRARLTAATWSEQFPEGETARVASSDQPLAITQSGRPGAYRVYDGRGATIDVQHKHDACITINASHVIVRGVTLRGAGDAARKTRSYAHAINILGGEDIIIEDCDVSDWGRLNPETGFAYDMDAAIGSRAAGLRRLAVQRCKLHHPTYDGSNWTEPKYPTHSMGTQAISLFNTAGNHVIRYNECFTDLEHMFNDIIGGGSNGSFKGAPGPDSDVYGNFASGCWDDVLEIEGGNRNTRLWSNYLEQSLMGIGNAATSIGPLYIWRNVYTRSQQHPTGGGGNFLKMGFAGGEEWMTGTQYIFHNTVFAGDGWLPTGGLGGTRIVKHVESRNNILHVREPRNSSLSNHRANIDNRYDFDLFNGQCPEGLEPHGVRGEPIYATGAGFDRATRTGQFHLAPTSPGAAAGEWLPNFSEGPPGSPPDIGAHPRGAEPMKFGVGAAR
ncbi:MAG: hypothetical protein HZA93_09795 [Verrucomicrobia bacterium]|nr:hypothetical protein [Verrucomicrobiota bacterium]